MGIALIVIGGLVMLGANLVSLPSVLHGHRYNYGATAAWGLTGFALFIIGMVISAPSLPLWAVIVSFGVWLRGLMYVFFGLRWLSEIYRQKQWRR